MSRLVAQLLLSVVLLPLAAIVYTLVLVCGEQMYMRYGGYYGWRTTGFLWTGGVTWIFIAIYWILLWKQSVRWTPQRVRKTALVAGTALVAAIGIGALADKIVGDGFGQFIGSALGPMLWLVQTIIVWRETPAERSDRLKGSADAIVCPTCGYNLTGLTGTRCPECGTQFTLTELLAAQPNKAAAELE
jgi:hypothetical protein